jgi:zinc transport system permease protein
LAEGAPTWADFVAGFQLGIYRDPVLCAVLSGLALGVLGVFVVLRRAVFVTAVVSQSAGLGVALAFFVQARFGLAPPPAIVGLLLSLVAVALLALPIERLGVPREGLLGFLFVTASALALGVGDRIAAESHDIDSVLFGTAVLVRPEDTYWLAAVAALTLGFVATTYRGLVFAGFDPESARVHGLPVRGLEVALWAVVATTVSVTTRALGSLPVFAFAVLPALGALAATRRLLVAVLVAGGLGASSGALGYALAYFGSLPVGASEATTCAAGFVACLVIGALRGRR